MRDERPSSEKHDKTSDKHAEHPSKLEHLVVHGRRGGSAITAAAINALASEEE